MAVKKGKLGGLVVPEERITRGILMIRGHKVMLNQTTKDLYTLSQLVSFFHPAINRRATYTAP